jgi:hypothetical protein
MTAPQNQHNTASNGGQVYASQGGNQVVNNKFNIKPTVNRWGRAVALLVAIVVDVCYNFYGMAAYTGRSGDSGDLYRAAGGLLLVSITGFLLRRLLRRY